MKSTATTSESLSAITCRLKESCVLLGGVFLGEDFYISNEGNENKTSTWLCGVVHAARDKVEEVHAYSLRCKD